MIPVSEMLHIAETNGARACGSAPVGAIAGCAEEIEKIRSGARSVIVLAAPHIRVIVATNRDLAQEVRLGRFRGDLFYRLNVFRVKLPPLRERKEEIRELVPAFIRQMSELFSKTIERVAEDYYEALMQYGWPGNVRELRNAIKYSLTLLDGTVLRARHLAGFFSSGSQEVIPEDTLRIDVPALHGRLSDVEGMAIRKSLEMANGNKSKAAKLLGIGRATLYRKLKDLG